MSKPGLLLWTKGADQLLDAALANRFELIRLWEAHDPEALIDARGGEVIATLTTRLDAATLARLPNLRVIAVPGAGYEDIDVAAARARGITVANAGSTHSGDVADHAMALVLASVHQLPEMQRWVRGGHWLHSGRWSGGGRSGPRHAMSAQRVGIVGLGNIGTAIAERLVPFGCAIAWWAPRHKDAAWPRHESLMDLAQWCTTLIVSARGDVTGLIDAQTIAAVGPDGLIVNISRGALIDEDAMIKALKGGGLGHAALDVFADEPAAPERWRNVPNVILTPHVGGVSSEAMLHLRDAASRNLASALDGGAVVNEIKA